MAKTKDKPSKTDKAARVEKKKQKPELKVIKGGKGSMVLVTKAIHGALAKVSKALNNKATSVHLDMRPEGALMSASSDNASIQISVPECTGDGQFAVGISSLTSILSNRKEINCNLDGSDLRFSGTGGYGGNLKVMPYVPVKVQGDNELTATIAQGSGLMTHFNHALKHLQLAITSAQDSDEEFIVVKVKDGRITAATYDAIHSGMYQADVEYTGPDLLFNFKTAILRKVIALGGDKGEDYTLKIGNSIVYIDAADIKASVNMTQIETHSFEALLGLMVSMRKEITCTATVETDDLYTVVTNMQGFFEADKFIIVEADKKGMRWNYVTSYGDIHDDIAAEIEGKGTIKLRLTDINDVLGTMPSGKVKFGIVDKVVNGARRSQVFIEGPNLAYLVRGSQ